VKLNAGQKADELITEAESKAEAIIDEAIARRRRLNQAVTSLVERREEIAEETQRLADQLLEAVEAVRLDEPIDEEAARDDEDVVAAEDADADEDAPADDSDAAQEIAGEPTELEDPAERETTVHETR
jgi:predicted transcriptional regulator